MMISPLTKNSKSAFVHRSHRPFRTLAACPTTTLLRLRLFSWIGFKSTKTVKSGKETNKQNTKENDGNNATIGENIADRFRRNFPDNPRVRRTAKRVAYTSRKKSIKSVTPEARERTSLYVQIPSARRVPNWVRTLRTWSIKYR